MKKNRKLLFSVTKKDLEITWYTSPGPGGQKKNKTMNACRMKHPESGAMVTAQERKERHANLTTALKRLAAHPKFKVWSARKVWEIDKGKTIEKLIDELMQPQNLKIEVKNSEGCWVEIDESDLKKMELEDIE